MINLKTSLVSVVTVEVPTRLDFKLIWFSVSTGLIM